MKAPLLFLMLCITCRAERCSEKKTVYSSWGRYSSPWDYSADEYGVYGKNLKCVVHFEAYEKGDTVELQFKETDLQPGCSDKVIIYDGPTEYDTELITVCGRDKPTVESSGRDLLLVFITDAYDNGRHKGFRILYEAIDKDGSDDWDTSLSPGTYVVIIIPAVVMYAIIGFVIYRRCKYYRQIRQNLAATGHTPEDLRMAMITMMDQVRRGPLNAPGNAQAGCAQTPRDVRMAMNGLMRQAGQGPIAAGGDPLQANLLQHMDQSAAQRNSGRRSGGKHSHHARTRHPAGDIHQSPRHEQHHHSDPSAMPFLAGDGSTYTQHQYPPNGRENHYSNNNVMSNNNTGANLNYQVNGNGYPSPYSIQDPAMDTTGVYYAGDVDEHGVLHPPEENTPYHPSAPSSTIYINNRPVHEEDRMSARSGSAYHSVSGNSPRNHSAHSGAGRRSPHHHQQQPPSGELTYYGMIDDQGTRQDGSAPSEHQGDSIGAVPPPSYDEVTGGGRLTPRHLR